MPASSLGLQTMLGFNSVSKVITCSGGCASPITVTWVIAPHRLDNRGQRLDCCASQRGLGRGRLSQPGTSFSAGGGGFTVTLPPAPGGRELGRLLDCDKRASSV